MADITTQTAGFGDTDNTLLLKIATAVQAVSSGEAGDATAGNQQTQITAEQAILAKLPPGQFSAAPSTSTPTTVNATALTGFTIAAGQKLVVQNLGAVALYYKLQITGAIGDCTTSSFNGILPAAAVVNDGNSPIYEVTDHIGVVSFAPASGNVRFIAFLRTT